MLLFKLFFELELDLLNPLQFLRLILFENYKLGNCECVIEYLLNNLLF